VEAERRVSARRGMRENWDAWGGAGAQGSRDMAKLLDELKIDLKFVGSHTVQPRWYKIFKILLLAGFLVGYWLVFGPMKTVVFVAVFFFLSLLVHMVYRIKTDTWKRTWLDFVVVEESDGPRPAKIGAFYYSAVVLDALIAVLVSQALG
jgi:hypothetical protein